jgi:hypothetical protein
VHAREGRSSLDRELAFNDPVNASRESSSLLDFSLLQPVNPQMEVLMALPQVASIKGEVQLLS